MRWSDILLMCLSSLWKRKLRTVLTVLGVVIGTTSIVVMISIGLGYSQSFDAMLGGNGGLTRITVQSNTMWMSPDELKRNRDAVKLDDAMIETISALPGVVTVLPFRTMPNTQLLTGKYQSGSEIVILDIAKLADFLPELEWGRLPADSDKLELTMGAGARSNFYNPKARMFEWTEDGPADIDYQKDRFTMRLQTYTTGADGSMQEVVRNFKPEIVGMISKKNNDFSYSIIMSDKAAAKIIKKNKKIFDEMAKSGYGYKPDQYNYCWVRTTDMDATVAVTEQLIEMKLSAYNDAEWISNMKQQSSNTQMLLGGIGGVAMLVAAISIANTMLMSIYERTKEIGVMKVLGCRLGNIRVMFLGEAALIGLLGGIVGLLLSFGLSYILNTFVFAGDGGSGMMNMPAQMSSVIPMWLALLGLAFSTFVGLLAGLYPAQRAMGLSALAAIRNE